MTPKKKEVLIERDSNVPIENIKDILRRQWKQRLANADQIREQNENQTSSLLAMLEENDKIKIVRKESVFNTEITETDMTIIQKRVEQQQKQFQEYQRRERAKKIEKVRSMFEHLTNEEILTALKENDEEEENTILKFTELEYLYQIRKRIALQYAPQKDQQMAQMSEQEKRLFAKLTEKRKQTRKKTTSESEKQRYQGRLRLDDALEQLQQSKAKGANIEKAMEGWSEARIRAYSLIEQNENAYFYRFNAPGESQRNGPWGKDEITLFMKRLAEKGGISDGQWGIFSKAISGRVGYQCSALYRKLIEKGQIRDPNYYLDEKKKAHYLFSTKKAVLCGEGASANGTVRARRQFQRKSIKKRTKKKRAYSDDDDENENDEDFDDENDEDYQCKSWNTTKRTRGRESGEEMMSEEEERARDLELANPLPGFVDPITLEEVKKPAISPYGHVMSYDSWLRCLMSEATKNICPLTKKLLHKRDLIVLTHDNIDQYRNKIVNWS